MEVPITDAQRQQIMDYAGAMSVREIAEIVGVSKSTVARVLGQRGTPATPARARASEENIQGPVPESVPLVGHEVMPSIPRHRHDRDAMADQALDTLDYVIAKALEGLRRASAAEDGDKRTWQEVQYLKIIKDAGVQKGKWAGLEQIRPEPIAVSPMDTFGSALEAYRDPPAEDPPADPAEEDA